MPANVTNEYALAERKYTEAKTDEERLAALQEMLRTAPKHKGSENLIAEITKKMKKVKERMEKKEEQKKKTTVKGIAVKKEGIGQIALIGFPNSGKSTVLKALTNVDIEIASYPFTTKEPKPAMMPFKGALIQLVEIPAIIEGSAEGKASGTEFLSVVRNADAIALILDSINLMHQFNVLQSELRKAGIILNKKRPAISVQKSKFHGITIAGEKFLKFPVDLLKTFLKSKGFHNASVLIEEPVSLEDFELILDSKVVFKKALAIVVDKHSLLQEDEFNKLKTKMQAFIFSFSLESLDEIKNALFDLLDLILVYTKKPGQPKAKKPLALKKGATIVDAAEAIHKEFKEKLKYAKLWGSARFQGQKVSKEYELQDQDVLEIYV